MFNETQEKLMEHEVRIRMMEESYKDIKTLLRWIMAIGITAIAIPVMLHYFSLT